MVRVPQIYAPNSETKTYGVILLVKTSTAFIPDYTKDDPSNAASSIHTFPVYQVSNRFQAQGDCDPAKVIHFRIMKSDNNGSRVLATKTLSNKTVKKRQVQ